MKCGACTFFDCGRDCRCKCHVKNRTEWEKADPTNMKPLTTWSQRKYENCDGLATLFG